MKKLYYYLQSTFLVFCFFSDAFAYEIVNDSRFLDEVSRVLAFGDSQTKGFRVKHHESYPSQLSGLIDIGIENYGKNGLTTQQALEGHLSWTLTKHPDPQIVIMTLGGNDILHDQRRTAKIVRNLKSIFQQFQDRGAMIVFVSNNLIANWRAIDHSLNWQLPLIWNSFDRDIKKACEEMGVLYVEDVMNGIWGHDELLVDSIHPNASGYRLMASRIYEVLSNHLPDSNQQVTQFLSGADEWEGL